MDLDVVGMAVAAALVVGGEDVGASLLAGCGERAPRPSSTSADQNEPSAWLVSVVGHAGVEVVEELDARDTEDLGGASCFVVASIGEYLGRGDRTPSATSP